MLGAKPRFIHRFWVGASLICWCAFNSSASVLYVDLNSSSPTPPYASWSTAATNIQIAVDVSTNGDLILVTNGVYATGGRTWFSSGTNRVTITNNITVQSVNGPAFTQIVGKQVPGTGSALTNAIRCVYLGNNAMISGFTLTNGEGGTGNYPPGGGLIGGTATNCILTCNLATNAAGGGAYRATLIDCQLVGNSAGTGSGGGACACTLIRCAIVSNTAASGGGIYGGGVYGASVVSNSVLTGNSATSGGGAYGGTLIACVLSNNAAASGGGANSATLNNCLVFANRASNGGGLYAGTITNCTVVSNVATNSGGGIYGGSGAFGYNSILYFNTAATDANNVGSKFNYCCTIPNPFDASGITNDPSFVNLAGGDFHLQTNSPCINSGNNGYVSGLTDLDGHPRIAGGTVDMGAYELQNPASVLSYDWLQQYGLPTDGSVDFTDTDADGMNNRQEWIAGTNPTNALSVLKLVSSSNNAFGPTLTCQSVTTRTYYLQRSTNLASPPAFTTLKSNLFGQSGTITYKDTTATNPVPYFYRVGIQ